MADLPPFLRLLESTSSESACYVAIFSHKTEFLLPPTHALWYPPKNGSTSVVLYFIPGNPGLIDLYRPFLASIYDKDTTGNLAILAKSHIGHTPGISDTDKLSDASNTTLLPQVQSALEGLDCLTSMYGNDVKILMVGHSMGCWISLQVLKARPLTVSSLFLICPTISHIKDTPNGRSLFWLFWSPSINILSSASRLVKFLPNSVLTTLSSDWRPHQILTLQTFVHSPESVAAALTLAKDEMNTIKELDTALLTEHRMKLWFYFAEHDNWVGKERENIIRALGSEEGVIRGGPGVPHAFCIDHNKEVADNCYAWISSLRNGV